MQLVIGSMLVAQRGFNTVNGKRVHATCIFLGVRHLGKRFNTVNGKRVHATLCPGALVGQALKMGFWSTLIDFCHFRHFRTCTSFRFSEKIRLHPLRHKGFRCPRKNRSTLDGLMRVCEGCAGLSFFRQLYYTGN